MDSPEQSQPDAENFSMEKQRTENNFGGGNNKPKSTRFFDRLGFLSRLAMETMVKRPKVEGLNHLNELKPGQHAVFATTHLADIDVHAVIQALAPYRKVDVASLETNQKDPKQAIFERMVGRNRFHDVKNTFDTEKDKPYTSVDPENYKIMKSAMDRGSDIVIAAHRPVRRIEKAELPKHIGIGAVYLAQLSESPIVPTALDVASDKRVGMASNLAFSLKETHILEKPDSKLKIGSPIQFEQIPHADLEAFGMMFSSISRSELRKDPEKLERARATFEKIKQQSETLMKKIAELLPPEKQGPYRQDLSQNPTPQITP